MQTTIVSRSLHEVGSAAWFGGTLPNAVALNAAAGQAIRPIDSGAVVNAGRDRWTPVKAAAIGMTAWSRLLGKRISAKTRPADEDGTTPTPETSDNVESAQQQLAVLQWVIPALTGALIITSAFAWERQRPAGSLAGVRTKLVGYPAC